MPVSFVCSSGLLTSLHRKKLYNVTLELNVLSADKKTLIVQKILLVRLKLRT